MTETEVLETPFAGSSFQQLIDYLREPDSPAPVLSPRRFSQALHIDLRDDHRIAGEEPLGLAEDGAVLGDEAVAAVYKIR